MSCERVNRLVGNEGEHNIEISLIKPRTRSSITRRRECDTMFTDQRRCYHRMHRGQHGFPEPIVDH
jgi:hypothetical protein